MIPIGRFDHPFQRGSFLNSSSWLTSLFNTPSFSLFTTNPNSLSLTPARNIFIRPRFNYSVHHDYNILLTVNNSIVDPSFPVSEPSLNYDFSIFGGWFGIPNTYSIHTTHIRIPYYSEILSLYNLHPLIALYSSFRLSLHIRSLVLNILPLCLSKYVTDIFLHKILPSPISPPTIHQCISNCFILQPISVSAQWSTAYTSNPDTNALMDHLSYNALLNKLILSKLVVIYREVIEQNFLCILNSNLIYLEPVTVSSNHIFRIVIPFALRCVVFNLMHASPIAGHMVQYKILYSLKIQLFWPRMRTDIKDWVKQFPHCLLTYKWRRRGQEVVFS